MHKYHSRIQLLPIAAEYEHKIDKFSELRRLFFKLDKIVFLRVGDSIYKDILINPQLLPYFP